MKVKAPHFVYSAFGSTVSRQWKRLASMAQTPHRRITKDRTKWICFRAKISTCFLQVSFTVSFPWRHEAQPEVQQLAWGQVSKPGAEVEPIIPLSAALARDWNRKVQHHIAEAVRIIFIPGCSLQVHIPDWLLNISSTGMSRRPLQLNTGWFGSPPFSPDSLSSIPHPGQQRHHSPKLETWGSCWVPSSVPASIRIIPTNIFMCSPPSFFGGKSPQMHHTHWGG